MIANIMSEVLKILKENANPRAGTPTVNSVFKWFCKEV
jgi:hypothetical protein